MTTSPLPETTRRAQPTAAVVPVRGEDREDFRNHLATADKEGRRRWLHPRKPHGPFHRARAWLSVVLLAILALGPFVRIQGEPLLLLNIIDRKFVVLGQVFWPQDMILFAVALLVFIMGIIVFTAAYGRLWCGWACPQTVLMEMVFRKIEYLLEGDAHQQRALARAPWTAGKIARKLLKQGIFLALSFVIGNLLLAYIIGSDALLKIITDDPRQHLEGLGFMLLFTLVFYAIFARFREQACTFICPYGRFQSTLIDEHSIVVAYDYKRGEQRARWRRSQSPAERRAAGAGDCIDCKECVNVCPTGIDIRNGTQMECVHCTACIDACDGVMDRVGLARGLIRYASLNGIEQGEKLKVTPRLIGYSVVLVALGVLLATLLVTRSDVQTTLLRAQGALFQQMPDGHFSNLYTVKVVNKTARQIAIQLKIENLEGEIRVMGRDLTVPPKQLMETSLLIELARSVMRSGQTPLVIGVYAEGRKLETVKTVFIGPRDDTR